MTDTLRALTTVLDLAGFLLLVAALAVLVWAWSVPGGLAVSGLGLLAVSWLVDARRRPRRRAQVGS